MTVFLTPESLVRSSNVLTVKKYGDKYKVIWCKSVRKKGFEECVPGESDPDQYEINPFDGHAAKVVQSFGGRQSPVQEAQKLDNNISRAKSLIFEYAYCNKWDYFITLTISPDQYDRYDLAAYIKDLGKWLSNYKTNHGSKIQYILIPEQHKDGAWHMHGLISGILPKHLIRNEHGYLDWPMYAKKFGFCSLDPLRDHEAVSKYITKYVTKELLSRSYGQRTYYCSKGLQRAEVLFRIPNANDDVIEWDFEHPEGFCKTSLVDNLDFMESLSWG